MRHSSVHAQYTALYNGLCEEDLFEASGGFLFPWLLNTMSTANGPHAPCANEGLDCIGTQTFGQPQRQYFQNLFNLCLARRLFRQHVDLRPDCGVPVPILCAKVSWTLVILRVQFSSFYAGAASEALSADADFEEFGSRTWSSGWSW
mmetsp:Transcript_25009/g.62580  ORF Transcript_25009/g.62580 Transcript_25009/m.62580 type:complete len:147 (-) Transcript_25009:686-1126(-)